MANPTAGKTPTVFVERVQAVTPELVDALGRLVPQLTQNNPAPSRPDLEALLEAGTTVLLIARVPDASGMIVGAGSVSAYRVPTGVRAIIEDVVVDTSNRGQGVGESLIRDLLEAARQMGASGVSLTSNPRRAAANRLYLRLGFTLRKTNSYYYRFA